MAIAGATQASYTTPPTSTADSGSSYSVVVSNSIATVTSSVAALTVNSALPGNVRFVSPSGNDSNPGTIAQPFQTIQHCATAVASGWACEVRAGTYRETVIPNSGVTIESYNLEAVVIDGSDPIAGWTLDHDSIYKANVQLSAEDTNQIFVGNQMMTEARWPNGDDLFHVNWATAEHGTDSGHIADPKLPGLDWAGAKIHIWSGSDPFGHQTGTVTESGPGQLAIAVDETGTCPIICPATGGYYYLFGSLAALDAEREWFYDTTSSTLYFMPPGGVDPNTLDIRGKQRPYAFDLRGKSSVTIRNLAIFASTIVTDGSSSNNALDGINAQYVSHFTDLPTAPYDPSGMEYSILQVHTTNTGIVLDGTGNTLENSTIAFSAGAGVALEGNNNVVRNNLIYDVDYIGDYASGIDLNGDGNTIRYNTIHDVGRQGIYIIAATGQDIGYNNLFNAMMLSRDGGELYACCSQVASNTRIHHNWFHETQTLIKGQADNRAMSGVGIDNGSSGFDVDQNVLWGNQRYNVLINGASIAIPNDNQVFNNTVPDGTADGKFQIAMVPNCAETHITNNRVVVTVQNFMSDPSCNISGNQSSAPGATEMTGATGVGCNFAGCSSAPPPMILGANTITPCPVSVFAGP